MAVFIVLSWIYSKEVTRFGKQEVSSSSPKTHSQEQPAIEGHSNEH